MRKNYIFRIDGEILSRNSPLLDSFSKILYYDDKQIRSLFINVRDRDHDDKEYALVRICSYNSEPESFLFGKRLERRIKCRKEEALGENLGQKKTSSDETEMENAQRDNSPQTSVQSGTII